MASWERQVGAVLFSAAVLTTSLAQSQSAPLPTKQSNAGDSISQGAQANSWLGDHPEYSWVQGTDAAVQSIFTRTRVLQGALTQEPESVSGAELVGGSDSFAAQAHRICAQDLKPDYVALMLGGNDVCHRASSTSADAAANLYSVVTWVNGLRAGLDQLAACLPHNAAVQLLSVPRVDGLYAAGHAKSFWCGIIVWPAVGICRVVTAEKDAGRREQIGMRINDYNAATAVEAEQYTTNANGKNPSGIRFISDWRGSAESGAANTSIGTYSFGKADINGFDCFHPSVLGQSKIACTAWSSHPNGSGTAAACLQ